MLHTKLPISHQISQQTRRLIYIPSAQIILMGLYKPMKIELFPAKNKQQLYELKYINNRSAILKTASLMALKSLRQKHLLNLSPEIQKNLNLPFPKNSKFPFGYFLAKSIAEKPTFSLQLLQMQNQELWDHYLTKVYSYKIKNISPRKIEVETSLDLSLFCINIKAS